MSKVSSQKKLAGKFGIHENLLSDYRRGIKHCGAKRAKKVSHLLGGSMTIWLNSAEPTEIAQRGKLIDKWLDKKK